MSKITNIFNQERVTVATKLAQAEQFVLNITKVKALGTAPREILVGNATFKSSLFLTNITPYSFTLISLVYRKGERNAKGEIIWELTRCYELTYSLRDKVADLYKNGKQLKFSESNITNMFAGYAHRAVIEWLDKELETDMYSTMYQAFGRVGHEQSAQVARFMERFMTLNQAELIYKSGVPQEFAKEFAKDLGNALRKQAMGNFIVSKNALRSRLLDLTESSPTKVLGVPKSIFKLIVNGVYSYSDYVALSHHCAPIFNAEIAETNKRKLVKAGTILWNLWQFAKELDDKYGVSTATTVILRETTGVINYEPNEPQRLFNRTDTYTLSHNVNADFYRMVEYAYYQLELEQGCTKYSEMHYYQRALSTPQSTIYSDYLRMADQLGVRREIYPKHLATQHDILARNIAIQKNEQLAEQVATQRDRWDNWEQISVRGSKYCMVAPKTLADLSVEASQMGNCVAGYANAVATGQTNIMFLREKENPERSVVTVEIKGNNVLCQAYQHFNERITTEQAEFLVKWAKNAKVDLGYVRDDHLVTLTEHYERLYGKNETKEQRQEREQRELVANY